MAERRSRKQFRATEVLKRTEISDRPEGFDDEAWNTYSPDTELDPARESVAECRKWQIGIRLNNNHASIIIDELLSSDASELTDERRLITIPVQELRNHTIVSRNPPLHQLHLRFRRPQNDIIVLALDRRGDTLGCERYVGICKILASWKMLQWLALSSCPNAHSLLVDDCATFTRDLVYKLLKFYLGETETRAYMEQLKDFIVVVEESARVEASSRRTVEGETSTRLRDLM
ncbi:hypothetical protein F5B19DRAFT_220745 [Rostrohypoxylon terebratum]|nr:hypothetical protein F5B19DRAFT_220745 [Rostrohypoxylon terebratum]